MPERLDEREDYGEERWIATGFMHGMLVVVVVYTERGDDLYRLIPARKATTYERKEHEGWLHGR